MDFFRAEACGGCFAAFLPLLPPGRIRKTFTVHAQSPMQACLHACLVKYCTDIAAEMAGKTADMQMLCSLRLYGYETAEMTYESLMKDSIAPAESIAQMVFSATPECLQSICSEK